MRKLLRPVAVVAAGVLTTTLAAPAQAAPADTAGTWLKKQLTSNLVIGEYKADTWVQYTDHGLSADVALALDEVGGHARKVRRIGAALQPEVSSWTADGDYAGAVAKAAVAAVVTGKDPASFGGVDLVAQLEERTSGTAPITGRIEDVGDDYANTIGQAFAVLALAQAGSPEAGAARDFLLEQQCADGSFRLTFSDKATEDQSCDADATSAPDTDATALSIILLDQLPSADLAVDEAIGAAVAWLKTTQNRNGSFGGGTSTEGANANSTGLAAWALGDLGSCGRAEKAADWIRKVQVRGRLRRTPLAGEKGAIAYDKAAYQVARDKGIKRAARDQWRRASVQAAPGLRFVAGC